ncbi:MAG TPA: sigma-70 family RNA polymerase sigma factor [Solirubrobacteraceae bacterium]|nr:sigma-70 family RNA polymerase sigma factor [Solirubrobacteraceae bacterium]
MLPDDELITRFCLHRDRGELERARELWEQLALANFDRVSQLVAAHRFPGGGAIARDDLPDATQEAFLRVMAMGASFREAALGQFRAALRSCVSNACLDFGRRQLRHDRHAAGSLDERYDPSGEAGPYDAAIARHSLEREALAAEAAAAGERGAEAHDLLAWAIARVENDSHREVLEMTYFRTLPADEIAGRLGISLDNVYARRSRGLKRLEEVLRDPGS